MFGEGYWNSPERRVLGAWFEDNPGESPKAALRLPSWFSNLLPEGLLREWIARERGVSTQRELQLLLHIGSDLPGAVQIIPDAGDASDMNTVTSSVTVQQPATNDARSAWKFSLAGVGMKFSLLRDGDRLTLPGRGELGDWIVKFPTPAFPRVPENEFATMRLASRVGIEVPEIDLIHRDALPQFPDLVWPGSESHAFAIRRFDRSPDGGRIHIEDMAQVRGWYSDAKYDGSFATVAAIAFRGEDYKSLNQFVRRLTFNFLIGNGDAHLKNWSLLYEDGRIPRMSPAYDLVSTAAYFSPESPETIGLRFNSTRSFDRVSRSGFARLERQLGITKSEVIDTVDETIELFFQNLEELGDLGMPVFVEEWVAPHARAMRSRLLA